MTNRTETSNVNIFSPKDNSSEVKQDTEAAVDMISMLREACPLSLTHVIINSVLSQGINHGATGETSPLSDSHPHYG
jgi:hypothetical protein